MLLWAKQLSPSNPHPPFKKRKLFCQEIRGLPFYRPSQFGMWTVFAFPFRTSFSKWGCWKEDWRQHDSLALPESGALLYLFTTEVCEISFTTVTVSMRNLNMASVGSCHVIIKRSQWHLLGLNSMSASLWDKPGSEKANNNIRLTWISFAWKGISLVMAGGVFPRLLVPQLILTEDQIIVLDLVTPSRKSVLKPNSF